MNQNMSNLTNSTSEHSGIPQITGVCLHTWAPHPDDLNSKYKSINYYGVFVGDYLYVTQNNKGDFYRIHHDDLWDYSDGDTYVTPDHMCPLPEVCYLGYEDANLIAEISAAHKSWKTYYRGLKARLSAVAK